MMRRLAALLAASVTLAGCGNGVDPHPKPSDTVPPGAVVDLVAYDLASEAFALAWTAPGDDGLTGTVLRYDIRYAPDHLTEAEWETASRVVNLPIPRAAGEGQFLELSSLPIGVWSIGLKSVDEADNWSPISNVVRAAVFDTIPPARISDLKAEALSSTSARLTWTAPGDDVDRGRAARYELRSSLALITEENWPAASVIQGVTLPLPAGEPESFTVPGLEPRATFYFALKAEDNAGNVSPISNFATATPRELLRLTESHRPGGAGIPSWCSATGSITFIADWQTAGTFQVYVLANLSDSPRRVTAFARGASEPSWSRDGTRLAVAAQRGISDLDRGEIVILDLASGADPAVIASAENGTIHSPTWSPDGASIAYAVFDNGDSGQTADLLVVPTAGGPPVLLAQMSGYVGHLDWSPSGATIVFEFTNNQSSGIWTVPASGGVPAALTLGSVADLAPSWSPDGSEIVFSSRRAGNYDIWTMAADGTQLKQVTTDPRDERDPAWSPDGTAVCFDMPTNGVYDVWVTPVR
ncbi:MAG: fibronectin type III domain-containing protein [Candidatus Eisenbacteria bacterium]